ncbi:MAG: glycoside hydrolase [Desulfobacula sp.]|uniref:isoamylase early set domain-containing protein n=1 Tax=Desulfobacula sp. TaxID=2593537 RepID=UPI001D9C1F52|nr:glycoside hydrolase [Desulfobacula sp.]MBT3485827.1 glycoside hydrolase [Desulfobacula sp.]MBT3805708.1 glycoside hydrolase [Desulfobacula sp.]MBT4025422.1 glycoside hydrolase [Desulfobacula sp.]MBT4200040.1 glycoside hydrolase [Desulfobacula sp.]
MSIKKQYLKTKSLCRVTFRVPKEANGSAQKIHVVGEFNKWNKDANPMKSYKNGAFAATIDLDLNKKYQFKYLIDEKDWKNDQDADTYIHCPYGNCDNSVVIT